MKKEKHSFKHDNMRRLNAQCTIVLLKILNACKLYIQQMQKVINTEQKDSHLQILTKKNMDETIAAFSNKNF